MRTAAHPFSAWAYLAVEEALVLVSAISSVSMMLLPLTRAFIVIVRVDHEFFRQYSSIRLVVS